MENKHFVKDENLEIRIKFDKNVTTAALIKDGQTTVKIANAICSKQDVFDEEIGAILAVQRLFGEKKWINLSKLILPNVSFPYKDDPYKDETRSYIEASLEKVNEEEVQFDVLDWLNVGDIVSVSSDFPVYIKGHKKIIKRGASGIVVEKLGERVKIQVYAGDDLVIADVYNPCECLSKSNNIKITAGLKTQLTTDGNSDGYSSPLAEMLEKEKEEERTIEKMTYFEGNTTYEKEKVPHVKRLFLMRKVVDGEPVWGWFMENGKFYPRKEI